jgi:hypothetical protein
MRRALAAIVALVAGGCGAVHAAGAGECGEPTLQLAAVDGRIQVQFALPRAGDGVPWRLVVVHEGHVAWRGRAHAGRRGALWLDRRLPDYEGVDHVSVRAAGPRGRICAASAELAERN